jgi:hypothetical protein
MFRKMIFRYLVLLTVLAVTAGCGTAPATATQAPVVAEATQRPAEPTLTAIPPTEQPVEVSPTANLPTPTPVENSFVASKVEDVVGFWTSCCDRGNTYIFKYNSDGTIQMAQPHELDKIKNSKNGVVNKFWFDGDVFHLQDVNDPICPDTEGTYKLTVTQVDGQNSELKFEAINEPCKDRRLLFSKVTSWVSP